MLVADSKDGWARTGAVLIAMLVDGARAVMALLSDKVGLAVTVTVTMTATVMMLGWDRNTDFGCAVEPTHLAYGSAGFATRALAEVFPLRWMRVL